MAPTLTALKSDYQLFFDSCLIRPERAAAVNALAAKLAANRARYERVGKPLGIPWYVIGAIHAMESGMSFSGHLHNGDPLSARTTNWPPGRPKSGRPPFTWEQSATDALTGQGLNTWKDWSLPGALYKLEAYNGWGYRSLAKPIPSPYLWSFSNHYKAGKYVADGKYSPTAVSAQCGVAVLLKRLAQLGLLEAPEHGPRTLQLTNPHLVGADVENAQMLLAKNPFGDFQPGGVDGEFGEVTADAVRRAKWGLGYPAGQINGTYGPVLEEYLSGTKALPAAYAKLRERRLAEAPAEAAIRKKIVEWALWGVQNTVRIAYSQGSNRLAALETPGSLPLATDCSAFLTLCYRWSNAPNPNWNGPYNAEAGGYTGTMLKHLKHIPQSKAKLADLVVWTPPATGAHVAMIASGGADPWLVSHGSDSGPKKVRFSDVDAWQRQAGHGTTSFLSAF